MAPPPLDLLIVGAGPIGLATAAASLQRGAKRVLVVEQASQLRPVGQTIDLLPNAYRFLCQIAPDIEPSLQPFRHKSKHGKPRVLRVSADGTPISFIDTKDRGPAASIAWWQLQNLLLNVLPDGILVLNHQLVDIVHDDDQGLVYAKFAPNRQRKNEFKNWMGDADEGLSSLHNEQTQAPSHSSVSFEPGPGENVVSCAAKMIVGADGINSVARRCVYRDTCPEWENYADALYTGLSMIGYAAPQDAIPEDYQLSLDYVSKAEFVLLTCNPDVVAFDTLRIFLMLKQNASTSRMEWTAIYYITMDEKTARKASDDELQRCVVDRTRDSGFSKDIISLSRQLSASNETTIFRRPFSIVPATHPPSYEQHSPASEIDYPDDFKRPWHCGRVVLAGDAVHANPPMLGQGAGMGFEDVYVLMEALSARSVWSGRENSVIQKELLQGAFEEYYARRIDRVSFLQKYVMNRISEYDLEKTEQVREKLWSYGPNSVKEEIAVES